jgi:hypothetical protein
MVGGKWRGGDANQKIGTTISSTMKINLGIIEVLEQ